MTTPSNAPADGWQADAHVLWNEGRRQDAINELVQRINAHPPPRPRLMGLQFVYYLWELGDLQAAEQVLRDLVVAYPDDAEVVENLAVMLGRQHHHAEALRCFERATQLRPESANAWDGLASGYSAHGDMERARQAGERSLAMKEAAAQPLAGWAPPPLTPEAFLRGRPGHHVIAFSLWGANPRYLRGALRNLLLIPDLYPGWKARFYVDESVPPGFASTVQQLGGELQAMPKGQSLRQKLCWRFLVANDPAVGRFLVRDCDSVVSLRERRAVDQWLDSERWFHVMRDWWSHTDPVLAGMWGGIAGVLPDLPPLLAAYNPPSMETANVDQWFLRDVLWGSLREHALIHDRYYRSAGSQPWPEPDPPGTRHVGQDEFNAERGRQAALLRGWIESQPWLQIAGERLNPPVQAKPPRTLDLRQVRCRWISLERNSTASLQLERAMRHQGFQDLDWSPGVRLDGAGGANERLHARGVALAHRQALEQHLDDAPLLLLEDDVALEDGMHWQLVVPADADALWVGISRYGAPRAHAVDAQLCRIERMFSTHAVLYLSRRYKEHAIRCVDQCNSCLLPFDIGLAFYQQDFNVYALNQPPFFQAAGQGGHDFEALTRGPLLQLPNLLPTGVHSNSSGNIAPGTD